MGLNKSLVLSYNRSVIYVVPVKTGKFLHRGGSHWFPFGGLKSDFSISQARKKTPCVLCLMDPRLIFPTKPTHSRSDLCPWIFPWPLQPWDLTLLWAHRVNLPFNSGTGREPRMKADNRVSGTEKLRHTRVEGLRKPWRWRSGGQKNSSFLQISH